MFRGQLRYSACPPPSINTDTDHSQPVLEDGKSDSRPEQAAMEAAIADFPKRLEVQGKLGYRDLDAVLSGVPILRKEDQT